MSGYIFDGTAQIQEKNTTVRSENGSGLGLEESLLRPNYFLYFKRKM